MKKLMVLIILSLSLSGEGFSQWKQVINGLDGGHVRTLIVDPITNYIYAGTENGIFLSTNDCASWTAINNGLSDNGKFVTSFAISENRIYAGTSDGVYLSTDNGSTWTAKNNGLSGDALWINSLVINGSNIYAGTNNGVFLSNNIGDSWIDRNIGLTNFASWVTSIAINGSTIFAGTWDGVYISNDNGINWTPTDLRGIIWSLATNGSYLIAGTNNGIYFSSNNGITWSAKNIGFLDPLAVVISTAISGNKIFAGTSEGVYLSTNNGDNWNAINNGLANLLVVSITFRENKTFIGTLGGGVFLSEDNGSNWNAVNNGLSCMQVNTITLNGNNIFVGTAGSGIFLSIDSGDNWTAVNNGLTSMNVYSIAVAGSNIFAGTEDGVFLSTDNGNSWTARNSGLSDNYGYIYPIYSLAITGSNIFAGTYYGIFLSNDNGSNWIPINGTDWWIVSSLLLEGDNIFAGTDYGVYLSADNGTTWTPKNNGLSGGWLGLLVTTLNMNGSNMYAGIYDNGLFFSADKGNNWLPVNTGLTDKNVQSIVSSGNKIFAGTNSGVHLSINNGDMWDTINTGLSNIAIMTLALNEENIFAGTFRDGIWKRSLSDIRILNISTDTLNVDYTDNSTATFEITSLNTNWTVSSSEAWLTVNNASGSGGATITLTASGNTSSLPRTATINISGTSVASKTVNVLQDRAFLDASPGITYLLPEGGTTTLNITSNASWTAISSESWLSVDPTNGTGNSTLTCTAQANTTSSDRTAYVTMTVAYNNYVVSPTVIQEGLKLDLSHTTLTLGSAEGASGTFDITSNTSWTVSSSETWLTLNNVSGSGNGTVTVTAQKNPTINTRNATFTIKAAGLSDKTVIVTQVGAPTGIIDSEGGQIKIYPNPANTVLFIEGIIQEVQISIYDIQGRLVMNKELDGNIIDISSLASGIYSIALKNNNEIVRKRFVKK